MRELKKDIIKECDVLKKDKDVILMEMNFITGMTLDDYLIKNKNPKYIINSLISCYTYLLHSLQILNKYNIVHFDLKGNNIMFNTEKNIPLIIDFGMSIDLENVTSETLDFYFFSFAPSYYVWCPEIHFLNYLINVNDQLTREKINEICHKTINNNKSLINILSDTFLDSYTQNMKLYYSRFIGMSKGDIIKELLKTSHTWDNYSLSNIFIRIISKIYPDGFDKNDFIIRFIQLLLGTLNPNPNKRISISSCLDKFENILTTSKRAEFKDVLDSLKIHRKRFNKNINNESKTLKKMEDTLSR
tara:strand:- start:414 stop:1319 length:906 start_codon:yes stop_codon:yes gene_type:complete